MVWHKTKLSWQKPTLKSLIFFSELALFVTKQRLKRTQKKKARPWFFAAWPFFWAPSEYNLTDLTWSYHLPRPFQRALNLGIWKNKNQGGMFSAATSWFVREPWMEFYCLLYTKVLDLKVTCCRVILVMWISSEQLNRKSSVAPTFPCFQFNCVIRFITDRMWETLDDWFQFCFWECIKRIDHFAFCEARIESLNIYFFPKIHGWSCWKSPQHEK